MQSGELAGIVLISVNAFGLTHPLTARYSVLPEVAIGVKDLQLPVTGLHGPGFASKALEFPPLKM